MTHMLHRTTSLLNAQVSIDVRDRGFARGALDGVLGWFHYVDATPCPDELERRWRELGGGDRERFARGWAIDAAAEMLEAAGRGRAVGHRRAGELDRRARQARRAHQTGANRGRDGRDA